MSQPNSSGPRLDDVVNMALGNWEPRAARPWTGVFGAAGRRGPGPDMDLQQWTTAAQPTYVMANAMARMFGTAFGNASVRAVGNETRTLEAIQRLAVEVVACALEQSHQIGRHDRLVVAPNRDGRPPLLMLMSPSIGPPSQTRLILDEIDLPLELLKHCLADVLNDDEPRDEAVIRHRLLHGSDQALSEAFLIAQPEVMVTRRPQMVPLCVPAPHLRIDHQGEVSTAGLYCRDKLGELGVTGCFHGTGPVGTTVMLGGQTTFVKWANAVQDLVFIPLPEGTEPMATRGQGGIRGDREPARADHSTFDGATNQARTTRIMGADAGLLRARPTIMLKIQTDPDTDRGDSGCALVDEHDRVLGFAFERTAYDDYPQFTDWIWAANALRSLELTPA